MALEPDRESGDLGQDQGPLDRHDARVLAMLRRTLDRVDPVPEGLVDRTVFAIALDEMMVEVAYLTRLDVRIDGGVRSDQGESGTQTMSFSSDRASVTITVSAVGRDLVRIDGWLVGCDSAIVALRITGETRREATQSGRFWFDDVPCGRVQLLVEDLEGTPLMVTPAVDL